MKIYNCTLFITNSAANTTTTMEFNNKLSETTKFVNFYKI